MARFPVHVTVRIDLLSHSYSQANRGRDGDWGHPGRTVAVLSKSDAIFLVVVLKILGKSAHQPSPLEVSRTPVLILVDFESLALQLIQKFVLALVKKDVYS